MREREAEKQGVSWVLVQQDLHQQVLGLEGKNVTKAGIGSQDVGEQSSTIVQATK